MKRIVLGFMGMTTLLAVGCQPPAASTEPGTDPATNGAPAPADPGQSPVGATSANQPSGGSGGGVAPMGSMGAGGLTPVAGSESVQGAGGGGVQQSAKNKAKEVANSAPSSLNQAGDDGG